ncbi:hypothetical protein JMG10_44590 [Nostoc ellipsosporum NOK]|nr:hypothetical protein [Nostoc ellipsosporum NOK]
MDTSKQELPTTSVEEFFSIFDHHVELNRLGKEKFFFEGCRAILSYIRTRKLVHHHEQVEQYLRNALLNIRENPYKTITHQDLLQFRSEFEALLDDSKKST